MNLNMRILIITAFLLMIISACRSTLPRWKQAVLLDLSAAEQYFCEIALGSEFGRKYHKIRKWQQTVQVYLTGEAHPDLERELDRIIAELNQMETTLNVARVFQLEEANTTVFLGKGSDFAQHFKPAKAQVEQNWGLAFVQQNGRGEIQRAHVYVDIHRATDPLAQKHLLREELTQILGLLNDSQQFPDSIFYQEWTLTTTYSDLDRQLIRMLYRDDMLPGMKFKAVVETLRFLGVKGKR